MKKTIRILACILLLAALLTLLTGCFPQISKAEAQKIAAETFGYNTSQVTFTYCKRNSMNAMTFYTVVYEVDGYEFNVGINAETSEVFSQSSNPVGAKQEVTIG